MKQFVLSIVRHWTSGLGILLMGFGIKENESREFVLSLQEVIVGLVLYAIAQGASFANASALKKAKDLLSTYGFSLK